MNDEMYRDPSDFIQLGINPTKGSANAKLYTSQYYMLKHIIEGLSKEEILEYRGLMRKCEVKKGLYCRHPLMKMMLEAHDNEIGMAACCKILGITDIPENVFQYGAKYGFNYNNVNPGKFKIEAQRQGSHIAFIKLCSGRKPAIWLTAWQIGAMAVAVYKFRRHNETASVILTKMQLLALRKTSKIWGMIDGVFNLFVDMKKVASIYYPAGHPIRNLWNRLK